MQPQIYMLARLLLGMPETAEKVRKYGKRGDLGKIKDWGGGS